MLPAQPRLPLWLKLVFTGFFAVLVPIYWRDYGPTNFLYFCDVALFFTLAALWFESPLLASIPLVGILLPQALWVIDFFFELVGLHFTGLTGYMFDSNLPVFTRMLSFFHFWLPFLLLWLVWKLGYDRRAFVVWTLLAWALMGVSYVALPPPPAPAHNSNLPVNVNSVFGLTSTGPQTTMAPDWYFTTMMVVMPLCFFLPSHLLLRRFLSKTMSRGEIAP